MKQFVSVIIALHLGCLGVLAQDYTSTKKKVKNYQHVDDKAIHFGFCVGMNVMDFNISHVVDTLLANVSTLSTGFQIQAVSVARLTDKLEFRFLPGVAFGQRDLAFYNLNNQPFGTVQQLESSYIELPMLFKYKSVRVNNYRAFLVGGLNPRFDLAKTYREEDDIYMDLKLNDLCYELGAGFDFYLPYFKLSIELRGSWGLFNVLNPRSSPHQEYQNALKKLRSSVYMISFYIE